MEENSQIHKNTFFRAEVPLWMTLFAMALIGAAAFFFVLQVRTQVYNYDLELPTGEVLAAPLQYGTTPALSDPDYFASVQQSFVQNKTNFIEADLSQMKLRVYLDGVVALEVPILAKGKEGSWWETPAGLYKIETKEADHFSSFGHVHQPWSMVFQGNFFIHGWPYYPDGKEVAASYSGGCIRLSTEDAKKVYDLSRIGMPVLVYEKDFTNDSFIYGKQAPEVTAEHYLAADIQNGYVILDKNIQEKVPVASVTKLVTGLIAAEYINLEKNITITPEMIVQTSKPRLYNGQTISVYQLMFPLLTESSNEAAEAIARQVGRSRFIDLMNKKAASLGMTSSTFADPAGSDAGNISTARDLFTLARYIYNNRSFLFKISSGNLTSSVYGEAVYTDLQNFNKVPGVFDDFVGGKIGKTTPAKETYVGIFNIPIGGVKRPVAIIVLGSTDVYTDVKRMVDYVHTHY